MRETKRCTRQLGSSESKKLECLWGIPETAVNSAVKGGPPLLAPPTPRLRRLRVSACQTLKMESGATPQDKGQLKKK